MAENWKLKIEMSKLKNTIISVKISVNGILDTAEEKMSELEDRYEKTYPKGSMEKFRIINTEKILKKSHLIYK